MSAKPVIAILGGTGDLGSGLAKRWLAAGYSVVIGSRSADKARAFAQGARRGCARRRQYRRGQGRRISWLLAVPFASHEATLLEVKDSRSGQDRGGCRGAAGAAEGIRGAAARRRLGGADRAEPARRRRQRGFGLSQCRRQPSFTPAAGSIATCWCSATTRNRATS